MKKQADIYGIYGNNITHDSPRVCIVHDQSRCAATTQGRYGSSRQTSSPPGQWRWWHTHGEEILFSSSGSILRIVGGVCLVGILHQLWMLDDQDSYGYNINTNTNIDTYLTTTDWLQLTRSSSSPPPNSSEPFEWDYLDLHKERHCGHNYNYDTTRCFFRPTEQALIDLHNTTSRCHTDDEEEEEDDDPFGYTVHQTTVGIDKQGNDVEAELLFSRWKDGWKSLAIDEPTA